MKKVGFNFEDWPHNGTCYIFVTAYNDCLDFSAKGLIYAVQICAYW